MQFSHIVIIYLVLINLAAFVLMGLDKRKAKKNLWRIPEKNSVSLRHTGRLCRRHRRYVRLSP